LPYTLELLNRMRDQRFAGLLYALDFGTLFLLIAILNIRGLAHWNRRLPPQVQLRVWRSSLRGACVAIVAYVAAALFYRYGARGALIFWVLVPLLPFLRSKAFGTVPARLRTGAPSSAGKH